MENIKRRKLIKKPGMSLAATAIAQQTFGFNIIGKASEYKSLYICQWNANKSYPIKLERV
jgi:hypothetical protein